MRLILISALLYALILISCNNDNKLVIESFVAQNEIGKNNEGTMSINYLVQGFTGKESDYQVIQNHVCSINRDSLDRVYRQYWLNYFNKSFKTNNANIRKNPKDFFRYSTMEDNIVHYTFIADSIIIRRKYDLQEYPNETIQFKENKLCTD